MKYGRFIQIRSLRLSFSFLCFGLLFSAAHATAASCKHSNNTFNCVEFIDNYDGDTFTVRIPSVHPLFGEEISIRILGIDAPELRGTRNCEKREAEKAQKHLEEILKNSREISLKSVGRDKYFRVLAEVIADGRDVGRDMLNHGLAVPYEGGTRPDVDWCDR